ncbi:diguanylate cyclase [Pseudoxanthomonas suwonensis 11-1]|uniref:diguanylate cyclase n=1 Tax=Pseudoxanthomonas suwonensis (strain 11-1) TaxID=743721 RepID=E6WPP7_PSEUU|nr:GGDEF domain-containing protein [Pseudoxanthomonas suwonensis]ADV26002.1 diguanylate cyclase [Pseudoxanthomonas suwonensis 11-1]
MSHDGGGANALQERTSLQPDAAALLASREYALFASLGRTREIAAGQSLFRRGDTGRVMYLVVEGEIELDFGSDLALKRLGPREFFGELGLLIGEHTRSADAAATTDTRLIELGLEEFQALVDADPALVAQFLRRAIARVVLNEQGLIRQLRRRNQDLETALDNLYATTHQLNQTEELARVDELTGLYNRRGLIQHLQDCRQRGFKGGVGLLLVDCDSFKRVNDAHGHLAGDRVLQNIAGILRSVSSPEDVACRLGGDEFCLLVMAEGRDDVLRYAEFVLETTRNLLRLQQAVPTICPVSIGACLVDVHSDWNHWYAHADAALYQAKRDGGNRVRWADGELPVRL